MEIKKTNQVRGAKAIFSELAIARESAMMTCILAKTKRQAKAWKRLTVRKEGFRYALIGGGWYREDVGGLNRRGASYVIG